MSFTTIHDDYSAPWVLSVALLLPNPKYYTRVLRYYFGYPYIPWLKCHRKKLKPSLLYELHLRLLSVMIHTNSQAGHSHEIN